LNRRGKETLDTELLEPAARRGPRPQRIAFSPFGMASTAHVHATQAAVDVLAEGGNAVDAAVTAAFALGVCEPQASGLGGQTMMLVHLAEPRRTFALDGSSRAPNRAAPESLKVRERRRGYRSATVPATPAALGYALERYGGLTLGRVLEPAIRLAEEGFEWSELQHALARRERKHLRAGNAGEIFLRRDRRPLAAGTLVHQPALAGTLRRLATAGIQDLYTGGIARRIHEDMEANGGLIRDDDLARIPWPIERKPLATRFGTLRVLTFPPPGAGRALIEMLHVLESLPERLREPDTPEGAVALAETIRRAAIDRRDRPFDPNFYPQAEDRVMLRRDYARKAARRIRRGLRARGETTHLSVMDRFGNVVSLTQSIERVFGACIVTPDLGFLYNDYMSAFDYEDISHPYFMRPNAAPWASVAPTLVFRGRRPWLAIGSPGSERIVSAVLQVLIRLLTHTPYEAVAAPRLHCSVGGKVSLEAPRFRDDISRELERRGFELDRREAYSFYLGCVQVVLRERRGFTGVADPRRDGSAGGPLA
jgi:gamma-glutamyltranspeptidase/glutathione hydrolase